MLPSLFVMMYLRLPGARPGRLAVLLALFTFLLAAAAGCSSGDDDPTATPTQPPATAEPTATSDASDDPTATAEPDEPAEPETRTVPTAYGDVEVPVDAARIVAVSWEGPWQLMELGITPAGAMPYGQWSTSFTEEQLAFMADVPEIGLAWELDFEAIAALEPDLIVGDTYFADQDAYDILSQIAPTTIFEGDGRGDWRVIGAQIADVTGTSDVHLSQGEKFEARVAELREQYADVLARPWTHISFGDDPESQFSVQYPTGIIGGLYHDVLGAELSPSVPEDEAPWGYVSFSFEQMGTVLAESELLVHLIATDGTPSALMSGLLEHPIFATVPAVVADQLYSISTEVHGYDTAMAWLDEVEQTILIPASEASAS